jgi:phenolic acid decarboxylase
LKFVGRKLRFTYDSGIEIDAHYISETELRWSATAGPPAGQSGTEEIQAVEVTPEIFFISWIEASA